MMQYHLIADACSEVTVEILVMDYWCNWSKCWTSVLVEDKTPVSVVHEVDDQIEITCSAYKQILYDFPGHEYEVSVEWIVEKAKTGDELALAQLDALFGGYEKVWRDEYGNVPHPSKAYHYDLYCDCKEYSKQEKYGMSTRAISGRRSTLIRATTIMTVIRRIMDR
ncbi:MAG: hypothetical protein IPL46_06690 [Saprospiraceae bacterium]|nr:hypothetical protein [Saprospiraceae bacterium]